MDDVVDEQPLGLVPRLDLLKAHFNERGDGAFTLVVQSRGGPSKAPALVARTEAAARRAARAIKGGKAGPVQQAGRTVAFVQITTLPHPSMR